MDVETLSAEITETCEVTRGRDVVVVFRVVSVRPFVVVFQEVVSLVCIDTLGVLELFEELVVLEDCLLLLVLLILPASAGTMLVAAGV